MPNLAIGRALALAAALACLGAGAQTMYKWVDEKGVTHFSEHPPPDEKTQKKASRVEPKVIPPSGGGAYDPNAWKSRDAEARKQRVDRGRQEEATSKDRDKRAQMCERARSRVAFLQNSGTIFRDNPDGTRTYYDDAKRESEMKQARDAVGEYCQ